MHDVIRDVSIYIADKEKKLLMVRSSIDLRKGSNMKILKESIGIDLFEINFGELPKRLEHPNSNSFSCLMETILGQSRIPFLKVQKSSKVLGLMGICSTSSLSCLHNLQTLLLLGCQLEDVAIIGEFESSYAMWVQH